MKKWGYLRNKTSNEETYKMKNDRDWLKIINSTFFPKISLMIRQKAHPVGKCSVTHKNIHWRWTIWEKKNAWERKANDQQKGFHMILGVQNPWIKRYRNFFAHQISRGNRKRAEKREVEDFFLALRYKRSVWSSCLNFSCLVEWGSFWKSIWKALFEAKPENQVKTHKWKIWHFQNSSYWLA